MSYTSKELLSLCSKNPKLYAFIEETIIKCEKDCIELNFYKNYGWKWDVEFGMFDESIEATKECAMICNEDFINEDEEEDGWEVVVLNKEFLKYSNYWTNITLDNGEILLLVEEPCFTYFQAFSHDKIVDGKIETLYNKTFL